MSLSLARWGLFCFLALFVISPAIAAAPNTLVFNGQLITSDATKFTEYRDCSGTLQIGTKEGTVFRLIKEYRPTFKVQAGGIFEVAISDDILKNLDYSSNDYYLKFKINATTPPTPEFTSDRLAAAPYAFMAYNQKGGQVYVVGNTPLAAGNARVKGEMQGANFGIKGRGNYEYTTWHDDPASIYQQWRLGTMEVYGYLGHNDGAKNYGLYASTGVYDPRYLSYSGTYPIDTGLGVHTTGLGGGAMKGIGLYGKSTSATKAAVFCENKYAGPGPRGSALNLDGRIQVRDQAAGLVVFPGTLSVISVTSPMVKANSIILLTVQNGYKERVWVHNVTDGSFWVLRDFTSGVTPHPSLDVAYLVIN